MSTEPVSNGMDGASQELEKSLHSPRYEKYARFGVAALSSLPWVGGIIGASAALHAEVEQGRANGLICQWLEEHQHKISELATTLEAIVARVEQAGAEAQNRLDDDQFLVLVQQGFRVWDAAATASKREYVRKTLTNAAVSSICSDDLVRLFLNWIDTYDETHFKIISALFRNRGATRGRIWDEIGGPDVREDAADADLFKLLISDLSTGHVLRQIRQTNQQGQFLPKQRTRSSVSRTGVLESAFEDTKPYELTSLGQQFATYALNEVVPRIA